MLQAYPVMIFRLLNLDIVEEGSLEEVKYHDWASSFEVME